jgi:hypothetical protein
MFSVIHLRNEGGFMKKILIISLAFILSAPFLSESYTSQAASAMRFQDGQTQRKRTRDRRRSKSIGGAFKNAGLSAGRGGKLFGKNIAKGKPIVAGREFGKGMGGFGKHSGKGFGRTGKKIGKSVKKVFTQ